MAILSSALGFPSKAIAKIYSTAGQVPADTDLEQGELALNTADRTLYTEAAGTVFRIGDSKVTAYKGSYLSYSTYRAYDIVEYRSRVYVCLQDGTSGIPPTNQSYWAPIGDSFQNTEITAYSNNSTIYHNQNVALNASYGSFQVYIYPTGANAGYRIRFWHKSGSLTTNNITIIAPSGYTIGHGGDRYLVIDRDNVSFDLTTDDSGNWRFT